ncbi:MAG: PAS-domain containing protein, partial [Rubrivivax sp.]|nr:PAS-domain containing protein [Rubrivivax sp.]
MPGPTDPSPPQVDSQSLLRLVFDHVGEGICVFDAQWRLRAWNDLFLHLTRHDVSLARVGARLEDLV